MTSEVLQDGAPLPESGAPVAVAVRGITKTYGTVRALDGVDLTLRRGTVHGLVGENGSGKSTLTKIIAGVVTPDSGSIEIDGDPVEHVDPRTSIAHGVRVIFQDLALFPNMTVAENLVFEGEAPMLRRVSGRAAREHARRALDALGLDIDPAALLGDLSTAERQLVAIARTVSSDGRIILMDEPTAALTHDEIEQLLGTVRSLSEQGLSFIFISHKLREVVSIADDVTVIRDGRVVASGAAADYDTDRITSLMTGGVVENVRRATPVSSEETPVMQVRNLTLRSSFHDIDLDLYRGRVLGLAGLVGSGRIEIGLALAGLVGPERGEIRLGGKVARDLRGDRRLQYVPDDRLTEGLFLGWSIADNIVTNNLDEAVGSGRTLSTGKIKELADRWRGRLAIKTPDVTNPALSLSGGNQQRVLLARALAPRPEVIILNNPTVGVDIGSRADIHNLVRGIADEGTAVLVISDEPAELLSVCDDIVFVHRGRIIDERRADSLDEEELLDIISKGGAS
ncbi:sugar ABC transporter ATP-binding protein [Georgenia sp. EYE_87]|uniref:sugar ABC transporter ATP-binding protein n=1 Tax=Georgenia sp. EYE_87 TaxID=2853448 RepID=UPI002002B137|nr:sugar ABC transporter ATP-binding protein [Georgenia sp. EYE_87]MCK6211661.1 sugar ABC transporter ATP-binding protein [Georgenia sp. EYE_87]